MRANHFHGPSNTEKCLERDPAAGSLLGPACPCHSELTVIDGADSAYHQNP